ncbi:uncharacterized protein HMPREF1120_05434 [Exophiala dermatitidis NIH/UT8656]|uniref:Uncharacterized protein n=1 Tax=Exophiala dermatitidis (strain ATCC 34100 / CBS 525.76 / NIH/UT8656) TaxID=858893 RepID=H6C1B2_EXODN|nr:uncharacterized protein HMPREF1120_05434 [Exophiala dermatitidis NIH/UT8656]EHY57395.1 hypothetical protein HMPREF1120_05434 [Exophiala dermatitidis NIH/UT8656]
MPKLDAVMPSGLKSKSRKTDFKKTPRSESEAASALRHSRPRVRANSSKLDETAGSLIRSTMFFHVGLFRLESAKAARKDEEWEQMLRSKRVGKDCSRSFNVDVDGGLTLMMSIASWYTRPTRRVLVDLNLSRASRTSSRFFLGNSFKKRMVLAFRRTEWISSWSAEAMGLIAASWISA